MKNVCRRFLSLNNILNTFERLQAALNAYIDNLPRSEVKLVKYAVYLGGIDFGGNKHCAWLLLAKAVYNPKVQVFCSCKPKGWPLTRLAFVWRSSPSLLFWRF